MKLNERAAQLCDDLIRDAPRLHATVEHVAGATLIDLGVEASGSLEAGLRLAEICMAGLATVKLVDSTSSHSSNSAVEVHTDEPVRACMASQYAGWELKGEKFFAMGSGPMRAVAAREPFFQRLGHTETSSVVVGVLETRQLPPASIVEKIATACRVEPSNLTLLVAPTASLAGNVQIVARSIETALHKLFELDFDLNRVVSGHGVAPLPPVAKNDLAAIGRTNDAILYGAEVTLSVRGDDASLDTIGPQVPSNSSPDHGQPFVAIFERYNKNFYDIDPKLFSPAVVTFQNIDTGRMHRFGELMPAVVERSFSS
jgi:methenyltetrahydromethanopterin cyclohydrolase